MAASRIFSQFFKFVLVGFVSTVLTVTVLVFLVEILGSDPVWASITGYVLGAVLNYLLNHRVTFISSTRHAVAIPKFVAIVLGGVILNTVIMILSIKCFSIPYVVGQVLAVGFVMVFNFTLYKGWAFTD